MFEQIAKGGAKSSKKAGTLTVGVDTLPSLPKHAGDRNRTSPFAFTGNKFEFRALGSSQSIAGPLVALNTIVAEALDEIATELEKAVKGDPKKLPGAVQKVLQQIAKEHGAVIFNGNGYSEEWHKEAEKRGLPNHRTTVDALPSIASKQTIETFKKYAVLSKREIESREEIYLEQYCKQVNIEALLMVKLARTQIFPAAVRYQNQLAETCTNLKANGYTFDTLTLDKVTSLVKALQDGADALETTLGHSAKSTLAHAQHFRDKVVPAMNVVRAAADGLEGLVADDLWPLPTYQEMLFIK